MIKAAELTQNQPGDEIIITHYVNPQLFWYYKSKNLQECAEKFRNLEKELKRYNNPGLSNYDYEGHEKVILDYQPMDKLIRAQILHVLRPNPNDLNADCSYIVWAIDYGFPIETTEDFMSPLPEKLAAPLLHIHRGGVGFILPLAQEGESDKQQVLNWHVYACNNFESELIDSNLRFDTVFQTRCGQNFGHLYIYKNGDYCTAAEYLITHKFAKPHLSNFSQICMQLPATKLCSWLTIEGESKMEKNCKRNKTSARCREITEKVEIAVALENAQKILKNHQKLEESIGNKQQAPNKVTRITNETTFDNGFLKEAENFQKLVQNKNSHFIENGHTRYRRVISNLSNPAQKTDVLDAIIQTYDNFSLSGKCDEPNKSMEKNGLKSLGPRQLKKLDQLLYKGTEVVKKPKKEQLPLFNTSSNKSALRGVKKIEKPLTVVGEKQDQVDRLSPNKPVDEMMESNSKAVKKLTISKYDKHTNILVEKASVKIDKEPKLLSIYKKSSVQKSPEKLTAEQLAKFDQIIRDEEIQLKKFEGPTKQKMRPKEKTSNRLTKEFDVPQNNMPLVETLNALDVPATQTFFCDNLVVAHTNVPLSPIACLADSNFVNSVLKKMHANDFKEIYRTQCFAWPHLLAGNSLVLINGPQSGRTWSYLPAICSQVFYRIESSAERTNGPMAIILVASTNQAEYVAKSCEKLLGGTTMKTTRVVAAIAGQNNNDVRIQLHNGCGILVATPPQLTLLLKQNDLEQMIEPDNLKHIVIDDLDLLHAHNPIECRSLIVKLLKLCQVKKSRQWRTQLVMISQYWDPLYMSGIVQRARAPLLLFGDFLEAAAYAHVNLNIKHIKADEKMTILLSFLESRKILERTVIFCKDDTEILYVQHELERANYKCLTYLVNADINTRERIKFWKHEVLVCTDGFWQDMEIQDAYCLIHYALSKSWSKFTYRFSTIAQHFENVLKTNVQSEQEENQSPNAQKPQVLVLLDESNYLEIPRFKDFLEKHRIKVHPLLLAMAKQSRRNREEQRVNKGYTVCDNLATFGKCDEFGCIYRHTLSNKDAVPSERRDEIPEEGVVSVQLLKIYEPNRYAVRLLKYRAIESQDWVSLPNQVNFARLGFKLNMHFANPDNNRTHWPQAVQDVCVIKVRENYHRVRILDVPSCRKYADPLSLYIQVQVLDVNTDIMSRQAADLLECPMEFRALPPLAINMRLIGTVPYNGDRVWLQSATKSVEEELQPNKIAKNMQVLGLIDFSLAHTIFIKNLIVLEHLQSLATDTYKVNLKQFLLEKEIAKIDKDIVFKLHDMFADILVEGSHKSCSTTLQTDDDDDDDDDNVSNDSFKSIESNWDDEDVQNGDKSIYLPCSVEQEDLESNITTTEQVEDSTINEKSNNDDDSQMDSASEDIQKEAEAIDSYKEFNKCIETMMDVEECEREMAELFFKSIFNAEHAPVMKKESIKADVKDVLVNQMAEVKTNSTVQSQRALPTLVSDTKRPQVSWYQTSAFIHLSIDAAEVTEYVISCDGMRLFYRTILPRDTIEEFSILLRGAVAQIAHEKRGLNVIVKLQKACCGFWPSFLKLKPNIDQSANNGSEGRLQYKLPWLKYNLEHAKISSPELSSVQKALLMQSRKDAGLQFRDKDEDALSDDELCKYECNNKNVVGADEENDADSNEYPVY